jgi:manganese/zinc/iron transport system permease protein
MRTWSPRQLQRLLRSAQRAGMLLADNGTFHLSPHGAGMARQVVRNHRLWELYLIHYAHIAPSHVDRDADDIEHVLDSEMLGMLEERLGQRFPEPPPSPHGIGMRTSAVPAESNVATIEGGTSDVR